MASKTMLIYLTLRPVVPWECVLLATTAVRQGTPCQQGLRHYPGTHENECFYPVVDFLQTPLSIRLQLTRSVRVKGIFFTGRYAKIKIAPKHN